MLASSAKQHEVDHYLDLLDARELADGWTTSADVDATKPEPDLVRAALDDAGTDDAVMVGDTTWDAEAAARAGIETLAVRTGGFSEAELTRCRRNRGVRLGRRAAVVARRDAARLNQNIDLPSLSRSRPGPAPLVRRAECASGGF